MAVAATATVDVGMAETTAVGARAVGGRVVGVMGALSAVAGKVAVAMVAVRTVATWEVMWEVAMVEEKEVVVAVAWDYRTAATVVRVADGVKEMEAGGRVVQLVVRLVKVAMRAAMREEGKAAAQVGVKVAVAMAAVAEEVEGREGAKSDRKLGKKS